MSNSRFELKVGVFVFIGLALLGVLLIQFSKGMSLFRSTYELHLTAVNVGGLKPRSGVLMSGVQVGNVHRIQLEPDGKSVTILLRIYSTYKIHKDARFVIEQSGFLGDQYVAIIPQQNVGGLLAHGDKVVCEEPLDLQEVARSAAGFIRRVDEAAQRLNAAIADIRRLVLNEETLTNLSYTVNTLRAVSEGAVTTVDRIDQLIATNSAAISSSASNLVSFTDDLTRFSGSLNGILETNQEAISVAVKNIESSTVTLKNILDDAHKGKGLAGTLLHNEEVSAKVGEIVNNLTVMTRNLNERGLWRVLFPKKQAGSTATAPPSRVESPKAAATDR